MPQVTELRFRRTWLVLGWLLVASVCYLSLTPKPPQIDLGIDFFDKISHITAYAAMMGWFMQLYHATRTRLMYALGFICMGVAIEILQGMGSARLFEYADMLANGVGVLLAWLMVRGMAQRMFSGIEQRLFKV